MSLFKKDKAENLESISQATTKKAQEIIQSISGKNVTSKSKVIDNLIVVTSASGGTGASTVVSNLAYMADKKGFKTVVIDLNIMYPIQYNYYGIQQEIDKPDLVSLIMGKNSLGECIETYKDIGLIYANNRGIYEYLNCEEDIAINNFKEAVERLRKLYDLVIIDTPMSIEYALSNMAFYWANQIYIVWDEGIGSIANTEKIRRNMAFSGIETYTKMRAILNKRTDMFYSNYPFKELGIELEQVLPYEKEILSCGLHSKIFCEKGSSSTTAASKFYTGIEELLKKVLEHGGYVENEN